jgi:hypothetical protein
MPYIRELISGSQEPEEVNKVVYTCSSVLGDLLQFSRLEQRKE